MLISTGAKKGGTDKYLTFMHNENCQKIGIREGLPQPDKEHLPKKKKKKKKEKHNQYNDKKTECLPSKILSQAEISAFNSLIQNNTGVLIRRAEEIKAYRLERNKTVLFAVNRMIEIIYMTMWTAPRNL